MESYQEFIAHKNRQFAKGKLIPLKDVGRKGKYFFEREDWIFMPQHNLAEKVFVFERLRLVKKEGETTHKEVKIGDVEYRFGYYIIGKNGNKKGKWTWGQFCPLIPHQDLSKLLKKAKDKGVLLA